MEKTKSGVLIDRAKSKLGLNPTASAPLTKLQIGKAYTAFLNPNQISHSIRINFNRQDSLTIKEGTNVNKLTPISTKPESLSFMLTLDGTGATGSTTNVPEEINNLMEAVYYPLVKPEEKQTEVEIKWGSTLNFTGYLESFEIVYTLFKPSGEPLRANVSLSFLGISILAKANGSVYRTAVKELELDSTKTIVNLCKTIYNTPMAHIAVAKLNKLTTIRKVKPGTKLIFPPIKNIFKK